MKQYLTETSIINYSNLEIQTLAKHLASHYKNEFDIAKNCFEYVRDNIKS